MTADRRAAIVRLLETRDDHLPEQRRRQDGTVAGFVHQTSWRESCPDCLANGRVLKTCETCHGRGWTERRRDRDPYATDVVMPYGWSPARHERDRAVDAAISSAANELRRFPGFRPQGAADELADANEHPEAWEVARRRMYAEFDYAALDAALERLRDADRGAYHALHEVYVYGWMPARSVALEQAITVGLEFVDGWMPASIRAPGMVAEGAAA